MARLINSFAQFVSANEDLRKYYDNARSKHRESIEVASRMIKLSEPPPTEQNIVESETPESQTNSKIGNTWNYETEPEPVKQKNKINPNITDL